jgi:hypothetical protein
VTFLTDNLFIIQNVILIQLSHGCHVLVAFYRICIVFLSRATDGMVSSLGIRELLNPRQHSHIVLKSDNFSTKAIISLLKPNFEKSSDILDNAKCCDKNRMEDIFPENNFKFVIEHHNAYRIAD